MRKAGKPCTMKVNDRMNFHKYSQFKIGDSKLKTENPFSRNFEKHDFGLIKVRHRQIGCFTGNILSL